MALAEQAVKAHSVARTGQEEIQGFLIFTNSFGLARGLSVCSSVSGVGVTLGRGVATDALASLKLASQCARPLLNPDDSVSLEHSGCLEIWWEQVPGRLAFAVTGRISGTGSDGERVALCQMLVLPD